MYRRLATLFALFFFATSSAGAMCATDEPRSPAPSQDEVEVEEVEAEEVELDEVQEFAEVEETDLPEEAEADLPAEPEVQNWTDDDLAAALDPTRPLPEALREALAAVPFDPPPESLTRDTHYWVSNENHHVLFLPHIQDHGGIYLGVGTDQNYLMGAWAKSPILLMMDFDGEIRNTHEVYGVIFRRIETPRDFIAHWHPDRAERVASWIDEDFDAARAAELKRAFEVARQTIYWRLRTIAGEFQEAGVDTFLNHQGQYDFLRTLWQNHRVFAIRGDLTADTTLVALAEVLKEHGLTMGLMYLSNAEQYFDFTPEYRRNISVQPFNEASLILRTRPMARLGYPEGGTYHYNIQSGENFALWLTTHRILNVGRLLIGYKTDDPEVEGFSVIRRPPRPSERPPRVAP